MDLQTIIPVLSLQLFADGGAAGGNGAGAATGTGVNASDAGVQSGVKGTQSAGNAAAEGASTAEVSKNDTKPDRNADYQRLIKGDYKDLYDADVQRIVQQRLKGPTAEAKKYNALLPTIELLCRNYGLPDTSDIAALAKAVEADDNLIEKLAMEQNMSAEEFRRFRRMEMQNAALQREINERRQQEEAAKTYQRWSQQAEAAKALYPTLDLDAELENPQFRALIKNPAISIQTAYEVIHKDEITAGLLRHATEHAAQKVAASVAANGARPAENGMGSQGAASVKLDPTKMTKAQRRELNLRASRGEKIFL